MAARALSGPPAILPLYLRAAAPLIPGASLLPFIPGRGGETPEIELTLAGARVDPDRLAAYAKVCGFSLTSDLPPTYPHILAFPLHMAVMADGRFPFGAVGLVHIENTIVCRRPIAAGEELTISVRPTALAPHRRGRTFSLISTLSAGEEVVWQETSTMLRRGKGSDAPEGEPLASIEPGQPGAASWRLAGDLGRRYAAVSGDRNPIHMHTLSAKAFGFPRAIAHGMWSKARCLAALQGRLPQAFEAQVRFRRPILLPSRVRFSSRETGGRIEFAIHGGTGEIIHLEGRVRPLPGGATERSAPAAAAAAEAMPRAGKAIESGGSTA